MQFEQITIVGVGLIGGSVGLAAKARGMAGRIVGVGRDETMLATARDLGIIDELTTDLIAGVKQSSLVVFCTPVDQIATQALRVAAVCRTGTILTDTGSTKCAIVRTLDRNLPPSVHFVGAHPIAGSEKKGPRQARSDLFQNRVTVVTPTDATEPEACDRVKGFWTALGCRVVTMTPEAHDDALARTSHLPHAIAAALARATPVELLDLTAGGFRDTTRIAAGDPLMWTAIFQSNRDAVLAALAQFSSQIDEFRRAVEANDAAALTQWLHDAKQVRDALGN